MEIGVNELRSVLPRTAKDGSIVRLSAEGGRLSSVVVGADFRVLKTAPAEGDLPVLYLDAGPLVKALSVRADDLKVSVKLKDILQISHGELLLILPLVTGQFFEMPDPNPEDAISADGFLKSLRKVAAIASKDEKLGIMLQWGEGQASLICLADKAQIHWSGWTCNTPSPWRLCFSKNAAEQILKRKAVTRMWNQSGTLFLESPDGCMRVSPINDKYPRNVVDCFPRENPLHDCSLDKDELLFAAKAVAGVLSKDEIGITLESVARVEEGAILEVKAKSGKTKVRERIIVDAPKTFSVKTKVNAERLLNTLAALEGPTVWAGFSDSAVELRDDTLRAVLLPLVV